MNTDAQGCGLEYTGLQPLMHRVAVSSLCASGRRTVRPTTYGVPGAVTRAHVVSSPRCSIARRAWCMYV